MAANYDSQFHLSSISPLNVLIYNISRHFYYFIITPYDVQAPGLSVSGHDHHKLA